MDNASTTNFTQLSEMDKIIRANALDDLSNDWNKNSVVNSDWNVLLFEYMFFRDNFLLEVITSCQSVLIFSIHKKEWLVDGRSLRGTLEGDWVFFMSSGDFVC